VVVLTNMDSTPVRDIIPYNVFDRFLGGKAVAWNARMKERRAEFRQGEKRGKEKTRSDRVLRTRPSHKPEDYVGTYRHPGYGPIRVERDGQKLRVFYNNMELDVRHYHYDVFHLTLERFDFRILATFGTDTRGAIATLSLPLEATLNAIVFERQPDESLSDPAFLAQFTGTYDLMGNVIAIELVGNTLHATFPGLPPQELVPIKGTEFGLKAIAAISLEFKRDEQGAVTEVLVNQLGVVLTAKKR
jgi:hypothetical protein